MSRLSQVFCHSNGKLTNTQFCLLASQERRVLQAFLKWQTLRRILYFLCLLRMTAACQEISLKEGLWELSILSNVGG
jgi:hypothetical protein